MPGYSIPVSDLGVKVEISQWGMWRCMFILHTIHWYNVDGEYLQVKVVKRTLSGPGNSSLINRHPRTHFRLESQATHSILIPVANPPLHPFPKTLWHPHICLCLLCFCLSPNHLIHPDHNINPLVLPPLHTIKRLWSCHLLNVISSLCHTYEYTCTTYCSFVPWNKCVSFWCLSVHCCACLSCAFFHAQSNECK